MSHKLIQTSKEMTSKGPKKMGFYDNGKGEVYAKPIKDKIASKMKKTFAERVDSGIKNRNLSKRDLGRLMSTKYDS